MPNTIDIAWFKENFRTQIEAQLVGGPFSLDLLAAIACQETGYLWQKLRKKPQLNIQRILELCVGDTIDGAGERGRKAFPRNKADLLSHSNGQAMFDIGRQALIDMATETQDSGYLNAVKNNAKFCRGYGIFQYDLQAFKEEPDYFLNRQWANFDACLGKCMKELKVKLRRIGYADKPNLTDEELVHVAIAYNCGTFKPSKGLKQGFFDGQKYYGEQIFDYLRLSKTVAVPGGSASLPTPPPGNAMLPPPEPIKARGPHYEVETRVAPLNLRRTPEILPSNVITQLPDGHIVRAETNRKVAGFLEVETNLLGAHLRGFAHANFLKRIQDGDSVRTLPLPAAAGLIKEVYAPRRPGAITMRTASADAFSLNEPNQPGRCGRTADELRAELAAIIDWLAVDADTHIRYKPGGGKTFCNIYTHDYCHLAGVYIPRVWWSQAAIAQLAQGHDVVPRLGSSIDEQRANDLYRWLRDFGLHFGWRRIETASKLQLEANQGAIGLIVARRRVDGRSGHIVAVVPETEEHRARRNSAGEVTAPLQSQAGTVNFRYGTTRANWWLGQEFAESAFWIHG
jgi:hypothetical protein